MTVLLVASAGGHLTELKLLQPRLVPPAADDYLWVSDDDSHARTVLAGELVLYAHGPTRRNLPNAVRNYRLARDLIRRGDVEYVVSTGAALSVPFLLAARRAGIPTHYIECATRVEQPSISGRILERIPGIALYTQHADVQRRGWHYAGSVYDGFSATYGPHRPVHRLLVVAGTQGYPFDALVRQVSGLLEEGDEITWQLGATPAPEGLPGRVVERLPAGEMDQLMRDVDVVIGHAGTGVALSALSQGVTPVLCARRAAHGEHVDDHQDAIASMLDRRGLAVVRAPESFTRADLEVAAAGVASVASPPAFQLQDPG